MPEPSPQRQATAADAMPALPGDASAWDLVRALWRAPVGLVVVDRELRVVALNEVLAQMAGVDPPPPGAAPFAETFARSPLGRARAVTEALAACSALREQEVEGDVPGRAGTRRWRVSGRPVVAGSGAPAMVLFAVDVTDATRVEAWAERAEADAERSTQILLRLHAVSAGLAEADTPGDVARVILESAVGLLDASAGSVSTITDEGVLEVLDAFGYPERALVAWRRFATDLPPPLAEACRTGAPIWLEDPRAFRARYPRPGSSAHPFERGATVALPLASRGRILGVLGIDFAEPRAFDEADRAFMQTLARACAEALERAGSLERETALRAEAQGTAAVLDTVLSSAPIGIAFVDRDLRFVHVNAVLAAANGVPAPAHVGRRVDEVLPGPTGELLMGLWRDVLETGRPAIDVEVERPGGPHRDVRTWLESWYPVMLGGSAIGIGVVAREITAQKRADAIRAHLLGIVGHDLRNPLSAVQGYARLLLKDERLPPEHRRRVGAIDASARRMDRMIRDLLDYTRAHAGGLSVQPTDQRIDVLLEAVREEAEASAPGRVRVLGHGEPEVRCDPERLVQAISNLVGNALRYGDPGEPVTMSWDGSGPAEVLVAVANAGAPIPAAVLAHLFEPFRQGGASGAHRPGLGLGLFIAREIARAHGGGIDAASSSATGTVFTLRVPRRAPGPPTS